MAAVPVQIVGIHVDPLTGTAAVLLGEAEEMTRVLPILIGAPEARAIVAALADATPPRPSTHDLATTLIEICGSTLDEVVVTELRDGVFFAELSIDTEHGMRSVSSRPSDGIALAVRVGAPISVDHTVLDEAAVPIEHEPDQPLAEEQIDEVMEEFHEFMARAEPSDFELPEPPDADDR